MSSLISNLEKINTCLRNICDVEAELLNSSLFSIFKKKNHDGMNHSLDVICIRLGDLIRTLREKSVALNNQSQNYIRILFLAIEYSEHLLSTAESLKVINYKLGEKAKGLTYSISDYNNDYNAFRVLQNSYSTLGYRLNTEFNLYASELLSEEQRVV